MCRSTAQRGYPLLMSLFLGLGKLRVIRTYGSLEHKTAPWRKLVRFHQFRVGCLKSGDCYVLSETVAPYRHAGAIRGPKARNESAFRNF